MFEAYRNTDSDFLMVTMHDAMETCADDAMAVQRTAPVYTQPPDYARESTASWNSTANPTA